MDQLPAAELMNFISPSGPESRPVFHSICGIHDTANVQQKQTLDQNKVISAPLDYLLSFPGKDIRGQLISSFNEWLQIPEEKLSLIKRVVELLHTASLLIDDIQDSSQLRRGLPVAHNIFGVAQTINSANYAYFKAQSELHKIGDPRAVEIFTEELLRLHKGQGMDLYWRDSLTCPTEEEYLEMVSNKTGGLFRLAIKLMQLCSASEKDCVPLVEYLGIIFQIRDDYQNLQSEKYIENKGFGEDLTEGKFSFPIIHSIRSNSDSFQLINILKQKSEDTTVKLYAIKLLESTGSFEFCRQRIAQLTTQARSLLMEMGDPSQTAGIQGILAFLELK
ncbi:geranylgeranyl pyrophosphate synthetase [Penicillium canescens]|nr:geranylgeranyl pyrophosphate synthetase [Penicillium canescens]KAJ6170713.1 geranylgeranyl pyrophosphate synthetase [Penicillium canescens]